MRNVNLYQPERHIGLRRPSAGLSASLLGLLLLAVLLDAGWLLWQQREQQQLMQTLREQTASAEQALAQAEAGFQPPPASDQLQQELQQLREQRQQLDWLGLEVQRLRSVHATGFSGLLDALAQRHVPGLWLDRLSFSEGGTHIELQGALQQQELLTHWLHSLGGDRRLGGREFARLDLQRDARGQLRFHLSSESAPVEEQP